MVIVADATTWDFWYINDQGVTALELYSTNGGATWESNGTQSLGAFDVLGGVPEPASMLLFGAGLLGLAVWRRRPA
jgi:hypothetical protein